MVIRMNKKKQLKKKIDISIIIVVVAVFIAIVSILISNSTYTYSWLVCNKDLTDKYHETLKFRYDINDDLYGFYREETLHDMTEQEINENISQFNNQYESVKEHIDDNFKYEINKDEDSVLIKTYIGVSIYPTIFNQYFASKGFTATTKINQINDKLTEEGYTCNITRK